MLYIYIYISYVSTCPSKAEVVLDVMCMLHVGCDLVLVSCCVCQLHSQPQIAVLCCSDLGNLFVKLKKFWVVLLKVFAECWCWYWLMLILAYVIYMDEILMKLKSENHGIVIRKKISPKIVFLKVVHHFWLVCQEGLLVPLHL